MSSCFEVKINKVERDTIYVIAHKLSHVWYCSTNEIKSVRRLPVNEVIFLSTDYSKRLYMYKAQLNSWGEASEELVIVALSDNDVLSYIEKQYQDWALVYLEVQPNFICLNSDGIRIDIPNL